MRTIIAANRSTWSINFKEIVHYRELMWMLAYKDYRIRYAQTILGFTWAFIQPLFTLIIFILVFNKAAKVDTGTIPYPVFAMTGMWAWSYFSYVMVQAGSSIIGSQSLISKVYFPRLIIPLSKSIVGFIDFIIAFVMLVILMVYFGYAPSINILALPLIILAVVALSLAVGIWLSALSIRFRDIQYIIPFMVQIGLYVTPVAYPSSRIPPEYLTLYYLNPMAAVIDGFRWAVLDTPLPEIKFLTYSCIITIALFISGIYYFKRVERVMADIV
ncbi:MAG: ABC transporter permease [Chitinophagales bacterium]|nr:ABC transporter permease [Chitinophagales bacterium]